MSTRFVISSIFWAITLIFFNIRHSDRTKDRQAARQALVHGYTDTNRRTDKQADTQFTWEKVIAKNDIISDSLVCPILHTLKVISAARLYSPRININPRSQSYSLALPT